MHGRHHSEDRSTINPSGVPKTHVLKYFLAFSAHFPAQEPPIMNQKSGLTFRPVCISLPQLTISCNLGDAGPLLDMKGLFTYVIFLIAGFRRLI
jgi:hypothetical protein